MKQQSSGEAVLTITTGGKNIQTSNYGSNSFQINNTGNKKIDKINIDVTNALYPDSVFDPFGLAGDTISKPIQINTNGGSGIVSPNNSSYIGAGGKNGFKAIALSFNPNVNGGFEPGEKIGFSVDMDPNSIAGSKKDPLDAATNPKWDVGGVSGAELIGSNFTVTFTDGTTATGQLQGTGDQAGSQAWATQSNSNIPVSLEVNNLKEGSLGTYGQNNPQVVINGTAGQTARVVLTKGFIQPANLNKLPSQLQNQLNNLAKSDFPANNAVEFQTVDVKLTGTSQDISQLFDFSDVANFNFPGENQLPLGFVASTIDPNNKNLPLGSLTKPIYLQFDENNSEPTPNLNPNPANSVTIEAETMQLGGEYKVENIVAASGKKGISLIGGTNQARGTAKFNFSGASGKYDIKVNYFDENDGMGKFNLNQGDLQIASVNLDRQLNANYGNAKTLTSTELKNITISNGDSFTLEGFRGGDEFARIDKVEFIPVADEAIRINAGGVAITDRIGDRWMADKYFQGGKTYSNTAGIDRTQDDELFQSERYAKDLSYAIPVENGSYKVNLNFAEIYFNQNNQRVFDVKAENQIVLDDLDIHQGAGGKNIAVEKTFDVNVQDGVLNLDFNASINNAKLSGIEILPA